MTRTDKRQPGLIADRTDRALIGRIDEWLESLQARRPTGQLKVNKKHSAELRDLVRIAQNLDLMLRSARWGTRTDALRASKFGDSAGDVSGYRSNLTVPFDLIDPTPRIGRLSPDVGRYLSVALALTGDPDQAKAALFRGTSLDRGLGTGSDFDWADRLAGAFAALAAQVDAKTELGRLFDRLSAENIHVAEGDLLELRVSNWLSETFHKFDFGTGHNVPIWLFDRSEAGTPLCGAPLFSPKVSLLERSVEWPLELTSEDGVERCTAKLKTTFQLFLALAPEAATLEEPARVRPWLLLRPQARLLIGSEPERSIDTLRASGSTQDGDVYDGGNNRWITRFPAELLAAADAHLFLNRHEHLSESTDLTGAWWCVPANATAVREILGRIIEDHADRICCSSSVQHGDLSRVTEHYEDPDAIDRHALEAGIYAPHGSVGGAVQNALATGELEQRLLEDVAALSAAHRDLHCRLTTGCPIAEAMLRSG